MRFVNSYTPNRKLMLEYYSAIVYPHRILQSVAAFAAAVALAVIFFLIPSPRTYYICLLIIAAFLFAAGITIILSPKLAADALLVKSISKPTTVSFGNAVYVSEFGYEQHFEYSELTELRETPTMFALFFGKGSAVIVKKGAFTVGNDKEFPDFLRLISDNAKKQQNFSDKI